MVIEAKLYPGAMSGRTQDVLTTSDHSRDRAGLRYVYPVVSRRAGGVSIGINLNPNNACNWRCIYCQVPNLVRGTAPPIDLALLEHELRSFIDELRGGSFMREQIPPAARRIADVALSGNGEPTSAAEFPEAIAIAGRVLADLGLSDTVRIRVITNGSLVLRPAVLTGLSRLDALGGEVWFKLDAGTRAGFRRINGIAAEPHAVARRLRRCASECATWVQTCLFSIDGQAPGEDDIGAYLALLAEAGTATLRGVHLYGLARPSLQPEAGRLASLAPAYFERLAGRLREMGLTATINP